MENLIRKIVNLPLIPRQQILSFIPLLDLLLFESAEDGLRGFSQIIRIYLTNKVLKNRVFCCNRIESLQALLEKEVAQPRGYLQQLSHFDFTGNSLTDEDLQLIISKNDVKTINLSYCNRLSSVGLYNFFSSKKNLIYISLGHNSFVDNKVIEAITTYQKNLKALDIQSCPEHGVAESLYLVPKLTTLEHFSFVQCGRIDLDFTEQLVHLRLIEIGPHCRDSPMPLVDCLQLTVELPVLEIISIYNMAMIEDEKTVISSLLAKHTSLKQFYAFSCQPRLILLLRELCEALLINFCRNPATNFISVIDFLKL